MGSSSTQLPFLVAIIISASVYTAFTDHALFEQKGKVVAQAEQAKANVQQNAESMFGIQKLLNTIERF